MQVQQPNQFHCYNQNVAFVNRMDQNVATYMIGIGLKKCWWAPFAWRVDVVRQNVWILYCINKDEDDESLSFLVFQRDVVNAMRCCKSKDNRSSSSYVGFRNVPPDVRYDHAKHYQVPSKIQGWCKVCKKNFRHCCIKYKLNLQDICFEIFHGN